MQHLVESHNKTSSYINLNADLFLYEITFCSYNPSSKCNIYLWDAVLLFDNLVTIIMQGCHKVVSTLYRTPQL